jgi:mannose-6-phosphate isomerase
MLFELQGKTQNYDWGKLGKESKVAELAAKNGLQIEGDKPYAELWMGTVIGPALTKSILPALV